MEENCKNTLPNNIIILDVNMYLCELGIYPFEDGKFEDFEKIFSQFAEVC
jgi:hypothetical protein